MTEAVSDCVRFFSRLEAVSLDALREQEGKDGRPLDVWDMQPGIDVQLDYKRARKKIRRVVRALPIRQRAAIEALFFARYTIAQTARSMGISKSSVVRLRERALKRMGKLLVPEYEVFFA